MENMYNKKMLRELELAVDQKYNNHDHSSNTINTCNVPWLFVTHTKGIAISLRKARFFNRAPSYGYKIDVYGSFWCSHHDFDTVEKALDTAIEKVIKKNNQLEEMIQKTIQKNAKR